MYDKRHFKVVIGAMAVLGLIILASLVYAGFTGQLNITGTAVNRQSKWDVHFENLSSIATTGTAKVLSQPTLNGTTTIEDYSVSTTSPGDTISFTFKVVNDGNYNASISSVSVGTPTCSGDDSTSNNNVCSKLSYTLTYDNGATVQVGDALYAKDYVTMKVTLTYEIFNDHTLLATEDVSISNLGITINYTQSGSAEVGDNGIVQNNQVYHQGEKITLNNEDYWIIANSGAGQDYVVALKDKPLTIAEVNLYGGSGTENNHVNRYTSSSQGTAYNCNGYGGIAFYSSETCNSSDSTGCTTDYDTSDIKYVVDNWALDNFADGCLTQINSYTARLITQNEFNSISSANIWKAGNWYWTMTEYGNNDVLGIYGSTIFNNYNTKVYNGAGGQIRPVINVYKSALETNNNNNPE